MSEQRPLNHRLAEESQLLAEEKWLVEAMTKIRNQRNSLQIERLHLESMKAKLMINPDNNTKPQEERPPDSPQPTAEDIMQSAPSSSRNRIEFEAPLSEEYFCNTEELNLGVSSRFNMSQSASHELCMDEEDDEEDSGDDILIDMNMLMTGQSGNTDHAEFILP